MTTERRRLSCLDCQQGTLVRQVRRRERYCKSKERRYKLDDRHQQLIERYTEIASLAGGLAHEIKNPLSTLNLNLQLLCEDFGEPQSQKERRALQKIELLQKECHRLEQILDDFLRFARVAELRLEWTDVNTIVRELLELHSPQAQASRVLLRSNLPEDLPRVLLDKDFIRQALLNLLLNATQAMPEGGELIVTTRQTDQCVCIDVIDTGVGMTPETQAKIYRPFFSTRKGGTGLGLPTTRKIIEAHHGRLQLATEPGKGTAFTIELPRNAQDNAPNAAP